MGITLSEAGQNAACNGLVDLVDAGSGPGKLRFQDAEGTELCVIELANPAFSDADHGIASAMGLPRSGVGAAAAGAGLIATKYDVTDSDGNVVWSGTIPSNMAIDNANVATNQVVSITRWVHTQPAS